MKKALMFAVLTLVAVGLLAAGCATEEEVQSEVAVSPRQAPAPIPLTFRERKERGLLTPEEQAGVEELAQMRAEAEKYNEERQVRIARERAEKAEARQRQSGRNKYVAKQQALRPTPRIGRTNEEFWADVDATYERRVRRHKLPSGMVVEW